MPIKKICPRCGKITDVAMRYCEPCLAKVVTENNRQYDRYRRDERSKSFYHSLEWLQVRDIVLNKAHGLDLYAYIVHKKIVKASTAHHIKELKEDWDARLSLDNLIAVSDKSHGEIHSIYAKGGSDKEKLKKLLLNIIATATK